MHSFVVQNLPEFIKANPLPTAKNPPMTEPIRAPQKAWDAVYHAAAQLDPLACCLVELRDAYRRGADDQLEVCANWLRSRQFTIVANAITATMRPEEHHPRSPGGPTRMTHETDPTGRSAHDPGAKLDAGKPRPALVLGGFARALSAVTQVGTFGAQKYTDNGWRSVPNGVERYTEAMVRHYLDEAQGSEFDPDSHLLHAAHLAWNALARLELILLDAAVEAELITRAPETITND